MKKRGAKLSVAVVLGVAAVGVIAAPAFADVTGYIRSYNNYADCNRDAIILNANPFDKYYNANCWKVNGHWDLVATKKE
ncbi:hypothetical protein [Krasilnikovia sp. M28-CT-15]|uniref:hypothetical protein n=1 Tax=Krasilnikovia sp. M28-CT-15 TaxID=3373540 RepID=UPI00399CBD19